MIDKQIEDREEIECSYHNFFYPFYYEQGNAISFKRFLERGRWKKISLDDSKFFKLEEDLRLFYNSYQYFNDVGRKALYGSMPYGSKDSKKEQTDVVTNYIYELYSTMEHTYTIIKGNSKYILDVIRITLSIYNTGIGVICFETKNTRHHNREDIISINDYGRRISIACIAAKIDGSRFSIAAEKLRLSGISDSLIVDSFGEEINKAMQDERSLIQGLRERNELNGCANFIWKLLSGTTGQSRDIVFQKATIQDEIKGNTIKIHPILDDRMFVQCLIKSKRYSRMVGMLFNHQEKGKGRWHEVSIKNAKELLHRFIYLDAGECSCKNEEMLDNCLNEVVYKRWSDYGTVYAITQHSFIAIGAPENDDKVSVATYNAVVRDPFQTMYRDIARLAIVQRASIIALSKKATQISNFLLDKEKNQNDVIDEIQELQKKYVVCQNQILLFEITTQLQGIELYQKFQQELFTKEQKEQLESQIKNLYEIANINENRALNKYVLRLTWASVGVAIIPIINDGLKSLKWGWLTNVYQSIISLLLLITSLTLIIRKKDTKNKARKGKTSIYVRNMILTLLTLLIVLYCTDICYSIMSSVFGWKGIFQWKIRQILIILHSH